MEGGSWGVRAAAEQEKCEGESEGDSRGEQEGGTRGGNKRGEQVGGGEGTKGGGGGQARGGMIGGPWGAHQSKEEWRTSSIPTLRSCRASHPIPPNPRLLVCVAAFAPIAPTPSLHSSPPPLPPYRRALPSGFGCVRLRQPVASAPPALDNTSGAPTYCFSPPGLITHSVPPLLFLPHPVPSPPHCPTAEHPPPGGRLRRLQ